ncbi:MAG: UDP-glucose/GDP-mannose dehydrogenase family protein, partial [Candidatus Levybacteria bacterium]|nr:UDP-glucose/GDP-mannose dehydrogenase family protein [Candidatus Levybacteria bacterium]
FTLDYSPAVPNSDIVFIAVGTPPQKTGDAELSTVFEVAKNIGKNLKNHSVVATKSTVPVGTNRKIQELIEEAKPKGTTFEIASVPEFLREGTAIEDTLHPDRIVIGTQNEGAREKLVELHKPIKAPFVHTNLETAELIKYGANSFLATKISFANAIAKLSESVGADGERVLDGIGLDKRIGRAFLYPGVGYGGSCFPKDVKALISIASDHDYDFSLLDQVEEINKQAKRDIVRKARKILGDMRGKKIAVFGLAFKPDTDDMRDAPSLDIIELLKQEGVRIVAYDPKAMENAKKLISDIEFAKDMYKTVEGADLLLILTDWNEFKEADLEKIKKLMNTPNIIDGRNIYDPEKARELGFSYIGVGR